MPLNSIWRQDERMRSDIYVTAQELLAPWQDPQVTAYAVEPDITLEWLMSGTTRSMCAPPTRPVPPGHRVRGPQTSLVVCPLPKP